MVHLGCPAEQDNSSWAGELLISVFLTLDTKTGNETTSWPSTGFS